MHPEEPLNPYAPPEARDLESPMGSSLQRAEAVRREHIKHEASIKSIGCLHILGGIGCVIMLGFVVFAVGAGGGRAAGPQLFGVAAVYLAIGAASFASGVGLRMLAPWARIPAAIVCAVGLLGFPIGTLINGYFLWLLLGGKGSTIFSAEYRDVIEQTPHIKYVPWLAIVLLVLLVLLFVGLGALAAIR